MVSFYALSYGGRYGHNTKTKLATRTHAQIQSHNTNIRGPIKAWSTQKQLIIQKETRNTKTIHITKQLVAQKQNSQHKKQNSQVTQRTNS